MSTHGPLTGYDACTLADLVRAAQGNQRVARLMPEGTNAAGLVIVGTARCIGDENGNFAGRDDDIRDAFMRVTTLSGFEAFWPMSDLIKEHQQFTFITNYSQETS